MSGFSKNKRWLLIGVSLVCLTAVIIIFTTMKPEEKRSDPQPTVIETPPLVVVEPKTIEPTTTTPVASEQPETSPSPSPSSPVVIPEISDKPTTTEKPTPILQPEKQNEQVQVPITKPKSKPKATEPPKPMPETNPSEKPNPSTPPTYSQKETNPDKKESTEPKSGDKNDKGQVYLPGFGWIEQGGPNQGEISNSDGDWDKQVGTMD
ncbi:DUF6550 family protein [Paenibacillus luteus]|uniref:DUF6550 family protein n=1 Tax=Paenibacillus luteus TaxID=2545753 RepID=UPI001142D6A1|nr:DUF6550 family protein [Paenibacillus luteus]